MGKKKNHSAPAAAGSSETKAIDELKNLSDQLLKEVAECRKQIEQLQFQLAALASHHNILAGSEHNVSSIAERQRDVSSSLTEAAAHDNAEMAVKKTESAAAQLEAAEMRLLAIVREKDKIQREIRSALLRRRIALFCVCRTLWSNGGRKWKKMEEMDLLSQCCYSFIQCYHYCSDLVLS